MLLLLWHPMAFRGESYAKALNSVLMASGLRAGWTDAAGGHLRLIEDVLVKCRKSTESGGCGSFELPQPWRKVNVANTKMTATSVRMSRQGLLRGLEVSTPKF